VLGLHRRRFLRLRCADQPDVSEFEFCGVSAKCAQVRYVDERSSRKHRGEQSHPDGREYDDGLRYLLNKEPDSEHEKARAEAHNRRF
jgi:hypothetical protein